MLNSLSKVEIWAVMYNRLERYKLTYRTKYSRMDQINLWKAAFKKFEGTMSLQIF